MSHWTRVKNPLIVIGFMAVAWSAHAQLVIPGADGSDGAFAPTANSTVVDLSQAATAAWNAPGAGKGVYDSEKWAVVFKYSSVNIPSNVTVSFKNHPARAPVVWLVSGNVNIAGWIDLNGQNGANSVFFAEPGPGGFRGGAGMQGSTASSGGFGPGGGKYPPANDSSSGGYATDGDGNPGSTYGNSRLLPLIGGSGGAGRVNNYHSGGAGGGAILIAVQGVLTLNGQIQASGGQHADYAGTGSGGAVRIVAGAVAGAGRIYALSGWQRAGYTYPGGDGRIRFETPNPSGNKILTFPTADNFQPDNPVLLWPPAAAPSVRVVSIGGVNAPADPRGTMAPGATDVRLDHQTGNTPIVLEARNVETATGTVTLRIAPQYGQPSKVPASFTSGAFEQSTWTANVTLPRDYFTLQAHAVNPPPPEQP